MNSAIAIVSRSAEETIAVGAALGSVLHRGDWVALCGALGSGKTTLAKGIARGLGVPAGEPIVSPTFVLIREYAGRERLFHADLYRLAGAQEAAALGLEEFCLQGVLVVEWADRFGGLTPPDGLVVELEHVDARERRIRIDARDPARSDEIRQRLAANAAWPGNRGRAE